MELQVKVHLLYTVSQPCELLVQIEVAHLYHQEVIREKLIVFPNEAVKQIEGEDGIGQRFWVRAETEFECLYEASVSVTRPPIELKNLKQTPLPSLPNDVVKYLMPSRFCHPDQLHDFTMATFGSMSGGALISAMSNWVMANLSYAPGASDQQTTAYDTFKSREGVCRDYAHLLIGMSRAAAIPARMVSAYALDIDPQDFHAVVEVYLDGAWHLVDPTGMAKLEEIIPIGVGRDAADVSFLTAYGYLDLKKQVVEVSRLP